MRYITFAALIKCYPRLTICGLSYAQITNHQKRLLKYLKIDTKLHDELSQPFNVSVQNKLFGIHPADIGVPHVASNTNPDDYVSNSADDNVVENSKIAQWFSDTSTSGAMFTTSLPDDDELLQDLVI